MAYSNIVTVNIVLQSAGITAAGFGTPLFIFDNDNDTNADPLGAGVRVKTYSDLESVLSDFEATDAAYLAAQSFLSNTPSVSQIKLGYRDIGTASETMAEALAAIEAQDRDFYFVTAESHAEADVLNLADAIDARTKLYFFSSDDELSLTAYDEGVSTDVLALVKEANYSRTKGFFHHDADTAFPECTFIGYNAPFLAGSVTWNLLQLSISASQDPATGIPLNTDQKGNLEDREAAYTERAAGQVVISRNGRLANGTPIDLIRGIDSLTEDSSVALQNLLLRQKGSKLNYTNVDISRIINSVDQVLDRYTQAPRNFLNEGYVINAVPAERVAPEKKEQRIYDDLTFSATAQGAIEGITINGTVSVAL